MVTNIFDRVFDRKREEDQQFLAEDPPIRTLEEFLARPPAGRTARAHAAHQPAGSVARKHVDPFENTPADNSSADDAGAKCDQKSAKK